MRLVRAFTAAALLTGGVAMAVAQTTNGAGPANGANGATSMWQIVYEGIQWPAWFILAGSLATMALIVEHFIVVRLTTIAPPGQVKQARHLIERRNFRECLARMRKSSTFFARVMTASLEHARHGFDAMHNAAVEKAGELSGQMFRKVEYMNIFGNLGPLLGLLGTVYGMIIAFSALGRGGGMAGTDAGGLATGIALALVNTLLGLGLAIIGLGFFGVCRNRVHSLTVRATVQALDLLEYFRPVPNAISTAGDAAPSTPPASAPVPIPPAAAARSGGASKS